MLSALLSEPVRIVKARPLQVDPLSLSASGRRIQPLIHLVRVRLGLGLGLEFGFGFGFGFGLG